MPGQKTQTRAPKKPVAIVPDQPETIDLQPEEQEPPLPNGVLVVKLVDDQGNISTDIQAIGNVQATEVQTLIELGLVRWREQLGFGQGSR